MSFTLRPNEAKKETKDKMAADFQHIFSKHQKILADGNQLDLFDDLDDVDQAIDLSWKINGSDVDSHSNPFGESDTYKRTFHLQRNARSSNSSQNKRYQPTGISQLSVAMQSLQGKTRSKEFCNTGEKIKGAEGQVPDHYKLINAHVVIRQHCVKSTD